MQYWVSTSRELNGNRLTELEAQASWLRDLADRVERGEVLSAFVVEIPAAPKRWDWNYFKGRGPSKLEAQGAIFQALQELASGDQE